MMVLGRLSHNCRMEGWTSIKAREVGEIECRSCRSRIEDGLMRILRSSEERGGISKCAAEREK